MLAVVVLWAAAPALACLIATPCHDCCHAMMMDCDSAATSAAHTCCQLHSSNAAVPVGSVVAPELQAGPAQALASAVLPDLAGLAGSKPASFKAPPPRSPLGASTILRI
jgi:hypothetical protein